jgi:hypothetical protein
MRFAIILQANHRYSCLPLDGSHIQRWAFRMQGKAVKQPSIKAGDEDSLMATAPALDLFEESKRILNEADKEGVVLRLFGGLAIRLQSPSATHRALARIYADIDFMGLRNQRKEIKKFFPSLGYAPREIFNALYGDTRLIFQDTENRTRIDVFLDVFEMCHRFDFKDRLTIDPNTISLSDLLATKLQVVEMTEREYTDIIALLLDHEVGNSDANGVINGKYIAQLCAENWGIYKTFMTNIANILDKISEFDLDPGSKELLDNRLRSLMQMIEDAPKSIRWKLRAQVGEKKRWYEVPEPDQKTVNTPNGVVSRG